MVSDTDNSVLLTADHGDAYPRGIIITEHKEKNENGSYNLSKGKTIGVFPIKGNVGGVYTGVSLGGIAVSDQYYLTLFDRNTAKYWCTLIGIIPYYLIVIKNWYTIG